MNSDTGTLIVCENSLDIAGADELRKQLLRVLGEESPAILDASNVDKVDTAALQVLTAFFKDADVKNVPVKWKAPTETLIAAAGLLGLKEVLHLENL